MTGTTARCNSVSAQKTAVSTGLTFSAANRRDFSSADSPSATIPALVIIGDRDLANRAAQRVATTASLAITLLYNNPSNFRNDDLRKHPHQPAQHHAE